MTDKTDEERVRLDKWLWAARFFKTRSQAAQAVAGGLVHVNGDRVKPSRVVRVGERLSIRRGVQEFEVDVVALSEKRGPATFAQTLYEETAESIETRELCREKQRLQRAAEIIYGPVKRPNKRERRKIRSFTRQD